PSRRRHAGRPPAPGTPRGSRRGSPCAAARATRARPARDPAAPRRGSIRPAPGPGTGTPRRSSPRSAPCPSPRLLPGASVVLEAVDLHPALVDVDGHHGLPPIHQRLEEVGEARPLEAL